MRRASLASGDLGPWIVGALIGTVLILFLVYPILTTILIAFVQKGQPVALGNLTLANFQAFLESGTYQSALRNTVIVGLATMVLSSLLAVPAAYVLARVDIRHRSLLMSLSILPLITPPFVGAYAWVILLGRRGLISTYVSQWTGLEFPGIYGPFGIVIALSLHYFPFVLLFAQGALSAADPHIEEAAGILGASRWRIVRTITVPLVAPAIAAGAILVFVEAIGNFGVPAVLGGEYYVNATLIYYQINGYLDLNAAAAIGVVNLVLALVAVALLVGVNRRRRFVTVTSTSRAAPRASGPLAVWLGSLYVWGLVAVALLPQATVIFTSFAERWAGSLWPQRYGFGNYLQVSSTLAEPLANTLLLSGAATLLCLAFGTLTAYAAARSRVRGRSLLELAILIPFVLPGLVTGVAFLSSFNTGMIVLTGTGSIIVLAYFVQRLSYSHRSILAAVTQLDVRIEEASTICGASWLRTMRLVTIPLIAPSILAAGILIFATLITELSVTILLYSPQWKTLAVEIYDLLANNAIRGATAVGSILIVATLLMVFLASRVIGRTMAEMFR